MAEIVSGGVEWLVSQLLKHNSRLIVYRRGTQTTTIRAVVGRMDAAITDETAARTISIDRDYIMRVSDLQFSGTPFKPRPGDRIEDGDDVYEVLPTGDDPGSSPDPYGVIVRVHTKQVNHA